MELYTIALLTCCLFIILYMRRKKKNQTQNQAMAGIYKNLLNEHIRYYQLLNDNEKGRFEKLVNEFLQYVRIEGVGTDVTDLDKVYIAASAVVPIFGFPDWKYRNLTNVILYPDTFDHNFQFEGDERNILGMVGSGYMNGQMLLSRAALIKAFSTSSGTEHTAIHEFVHLLDMSDGATDGVPENLMRHEYAVPWLKMMHEEMRAIEQGRSDINPYAVTNEAEFLAVTSEYFFQKPEKFKQHHPEMYAQMSRIFGQTPPGADS
ncbi:M90 family metallopeptidase [Chitinophaga agri]|uniref:Zinc-dependent peptidase n=1 Tax=Chitinophaga agri TaxID=2703787 RepID=A0A6B9ZQT9_9BACT|nr:M90 family metallopeptidase [Chitinophaga agri]QHS63773.1 zinc-dependent peptidase [Chitinophaga agri]